MRKIEDQNNENKQYRENQIAAAIEEHTYESDQELILNPDGEQKLEAEAQ